MVPCLFALLYLGLLFSLIKKEGIGMKIFLEELKKRFPGAVSINITREGYENDLSFEEKQHYTEVALANYHNFDYEVLNTSLEDLKQQVERIVDCEGKKDENDD